MTGIRNALLWVIAPSHIAWMEAGSHGAPPWGATALHGSTRLLLLVAFIGMLALGKTVAAVLLLVVFAVMVLGGIGLHKLLERALRPTR